MASSATARRSIVNPIAIIVFVSSSLTSNIKERGVSRIPVSNISKPLSFARLFSARFQDEPARASRSRASNFFHCARILSFSIRFATAVRTLPVRMVAGLGKRRVLLVVAADRQSRLWHVAAVPDQSTLQLSGARPPPWDLRA